MIKHTNRLSSLFQKKLPFTGIPFSNPTSIALPGITHETQKVTLELLEKNHQEFDIFYDDRLFHNHFVHHVLAAYSLGASVDNLKDVYDKNYIKYQRPKPSSKVKITRENWREHLGKPELWTDYLKFFDNVVKEDGMEKSFYEYAFHPELFHRLFGGTFHAGIHIGYALEFQIPLVLSEGLAEAAVHPNEYNKVLDEKFFSSEKTQKKSIMDIVKSTQKENRFNILTNSTVGKTPKILAERGDLVREYAKDWDVAETEEGIKEALRELYDASVILYGATAFRPGYEATHLDFFLMHVLTSILMIVEILPYVSLDKQRMLIKAHFAGLLAEYIAQGRPALHIDAMNNYISKTMPDSPNPWLEVVRASLLVEDCHVMKVVRSLLRAEQLWSPEGNDNIYLKLAQLTCESYGADGWTRGVGFDEQWTDTNAPRVRMEWKALGY